MHIRSRRFEPVPYFENNLVSGNEENKGFKQIGAVSEQCFI